MKVPPTAIIMNIVSIDLGYKIGVVIYDIAHKEVMYAAEVSDMDDTAKNFLSDLFQRSDLSILELILEEMPSIEDHILRRRYVMLCELATVLIKPAHWKPFAKANKWRPNFKSIHVRDAYNMLRYYTLIKRDIDIGEME